MAQSQKVAKWVQRVLDNRAAVFKLQHVLGNLVGLLLVVFGVAFGGSRFELICLGARTQGTIIGYEEGHWTSFDGSGGVVFHDPFMPIVEFQVGSGADLIPVRFVDRVGTQSAGGKGAQVTVLYDRNNPQSALVDHPIMNWLPWAPALFLGVFLLVISLVRHLRATF